MQTENLEGQESIFDRDSGSGKMSSVLSQVGGTLKRVKKSLGRIFKKSSKRSSKLKNHTFMLLDLRPGAGNMLGAYWEYDPPWLGSFGTLNTSECPKDAVECSLWQILQATAPSRYLEMSRNVQSGNTQNLKSMVIQRSFPKWSVAERRKTAVASDQAAVCACAHSRYFAGGSPSGLRV